MTQLPERPPSAAEPRDPGEQSELDLSVVATGHAGVDAALTGLEGLGQRPINDHPDIFEAVHGGLAEAMSEFAEDMSPTSSESTDE